MAKDQKHISDIPEMLAKWDFTKNVENPGEVCIGTNKKYYWLCKKGHNYYRSAHVQLHSGCPICAGKVVVIGENDLLSVAPAICKEWDYEKNGTKPEEYTSHSQKSVFWKCSVCGCSWQARIANRVNNHSGCPNCSTSKQTSFPEQAVFYYIKQIFSSADNRVQLENQYTLDIYFEDPKTAIEYDGYAWHKDDVNRIRDEVKSNYCRDNGIRLIRIKEIKAPCDTKIVDNTIFYHRDKKDIELGNVLKLLFEKLLSVQSPDINILRDKDSILDSYQNVNWKKSLAYKRPDLLKEWDYRENNPMNPERLSFRSNYNAHWICEKGHRYQMTIDKRSGGRQCPYCSSRKLMVGENDFESWCKREGKEFLIDEWDSERNTDTPSNHFPGDKRKVFWKCSKCGYTWPSAILERTHGKGCPNCFKGKRYRKVQKLDKDFVILSQYESISEASRENNVGISNISAVCRGKAKSAGGYIWRFVE